MELHARQWKVAFPRPALVMGVVNVTPDSFSDGGDYLDASAAVDHALHLVEQGAEILDIGGESTRPGAAPVDETEELRRVLPVLRKLSDQTRIPLSIDTMKPAVARAALDEGVSLINDVAANRADPAMGRLVGEYGAGYVLMHMQGTPQTMQENPQYEDIAEDINRFFGERLQRLGDAGVRPEQIILDVGIGFGKTLVHNLALLAGLDHFKTWRRPLLVGASRKRFIGEITGATLARDRLPGSLACATWSVAAGAKIIRTHDVAETLQAIRMTEALLASQSHD